jgi:aryl sulfotransferase
MADAISQAQKLPTRTRVYQFHIFDSLRWNFVALRDDDVVVVTSYKSGTTWMQGIVANLIFLGHELPAPLLELSPWVERRGAPLELVLTRLEQQIHRRVMKTHLPLDGFPYDQRVKYVYVGRDVRDVFMSQWNHYRNFTEAALTAFNTTPGRVGPELPPCPDDIHEVWRNLMTRSWFEWETEGYPWCSPLRHPQLWWDYRHLPNILFVHYADLLADFQGETRRVAEFLEIDVPDEAWPRILHNCTLAEMRAAATRQEAVRPALSAVLKGGAETFFYKGTNGRWREVLSEEELALYDEAAKRVMTPECRYWLENGRRGSA